MKIQIGEKFFIKSYSSARLREVIHKTRTAGYEEETLDNHGRKFKNNSSEVAYIISSESMHTLWIESARRR